MDILSLQKDTVYGRRFNFAAIQSINQFQKAHPLTTYENYRSLIESIASNGNFAQLVAEPITLFQETAGTTGKVKLIPRTDRLSLSFLKSTLATDGIIESYFKSEKAGKQRRGLLLGNALPAKLTPSGIPRGTGTSGELRRSLGKFKSVQSIIRLMFSSPPSVFLIPDYQSACYCHLLFGLSEVNLTFISANFATNVLEAIKILEKKWQHLINDIRLGQINEAVKLDESIRDELQTLLKPNPKRAEALRAEFEKGLRGILPRIWSKLSQIHCITSGSMQLYQHSLKFYAGEVSFYSGIYGASEAWIGVNFEPQREPPVYVLTPHSAFFEFIPEREIDADIPSTVNLTSLKVGEIYEVVVTTVAGLYRYRMGDMVKCVGYNNQSPIVEFLYRRQSLLNLAGEKVSENIILEALIEAVKLLGIENIFSRITGASISNIDGLIRANGSANLFLLNPNGIVLGPNARLALGGSFLGSTASSIVFADGFDFSAKNPSASSLLTVSVPIGLDFTGSPGTIRVQGKGNSLVDFSPFLPFRGRNPSASLQVQPGQTLALIGGDLAISGGVITAEGGRIELASVDEGLVHFARTPSWTFNYEGISNFKDIELSSRSLVDASGFKSGSIQVQGANISLTEGSVILIQNQGLQPSGNLIVNASESLFINGVVLLGRSSLGNSYVFSGLYSEAIGTGRGANVVVSAPQLVVEEGTVGTTTFSSAAGGDMSLSAQKLTVANGGAIGTFTGSTGSGGNVQINASESLLVIGFSPIFLDSLSAILTNNQGSGDGGDITLSTQQLTVKDRGFIGSNVINIGQGRGGNVTLNVADSTQLIGGRGLETPSVLASSTFSQGSAGTLTLNTSKLVIQDGAAITASTFANGNAGGVVINASDFVEISDGVISSAAEMPPETFRQLLGLPLEPSGFSGNLTINTQQLKLKGGAQVTVRNDGTGNAGFLNINADSILLENTAGITASTQSGEGGDINIASQDVRLFDNSQISATAGGTGNGGNITIDTNSLLALDNSRITANAFEGKGGNIAINAQVAFISSDSTVSASSQLGVDGTVDINTPENNLQSALNPLNVELVIPTDLIEGSCLAGRSPAATFTNAGTGGLPISPDNSVEAFSAEAEPSGANQNRGTNQKPITIGIVQKEFVSWKPGMPIVPANRIVQLSDGRVVSVTSVQITPIQLEKLFCSQSK